MENPVCRITFSVVSVTITNQIVRMFIQILCNDRHNHPSGLLIGSAATLTLGKPEQKVEHAMSANLRHFNKAKRIKAIRGIIKLNRRIASFS